MNPVDDLPPEVLAEIDADVARYRAGRINAARKRLGMTAGFVTVSYAEQAEITRRWLRGETIKAIAKSLDWEPVAISGMFGDFAWAFSEDEFFTDSGWYDDPKIRRQMIGAALAKFDGGERARHESTVRRLSPSHLEKRRLSRKQRVSF